MFKIYTRAIIISDSLNILLVRKKSNQKIGGGEWLLPGGTMEFGENLDQALIREIQEETNLDIKEINILSQKKMIIGDTHWLGIYYLCRVKDETKVTNMEPDKHDIVGFFPLKELPNMKDYMMIKMLYNFPKEFFNVKTCEWRQHSMQKHLFKYIEKKVHSSIIENIDTINSIQIIGNYDRSNIVSKEEKNDKPFNYKRPTAIIDGDTLYLSCFPGEDYIKHYANIIATYFHINKIKSPLISYRLPDENFIYNIFYEHGGDKIPSCDTIIFGNIEKLGIFEDGKFEKCGDFSYKEGIINNKKILLLGCEFSIWGNTGKYLIEALSQKTKFKRFIYVGKLGVINEKIEANKYLATGNSSHINGKIVTWKNIFSNNHDKNLIHSDHVTCYSILEETIYNIGEYKKYGDFIDPEIGNMALGCQKNGKQFSYLHIISDNVVLSGNENLSNERKKEIIEKRKKLFSQIGEILHKSL